jgi:secreted trypsin-like serine protease
MKCRLLGACFAAITGLAVGSAWGQAPAPGVVGSAKAAAPKVASSPKIVGPNVTAASSAQYGSVVAITYWLADAKQYMCTGTLLTTRLVLTAGHCGCGLPGTYGVNVNEDARNSDPSQLYKIDGVPILFDQRICANQQLWGGNDLALIRLAAELDLNRPGAAQEVANISAGYGYPADMVFNLRAILTKGKSVTAIGYGYTSTAVIGIRMQAQIPIYSFDCEEGALSSICSPFAEMLLSEAPGPRVRTDTCGGDSGGPVFWFPNGAPRLLAVTSRAAPGLQDDPNLHCGGGGIYTLIGRNTVHQWLKANGIPEVH